MRPVVIVVVLPFAQLLVEQVNVVGYAALVQELVELLVVNPMRALDLAIEVWCPRADVDMANVQRLDVPMELRLKLRPVVSLNDVDAEGQPTQDIQPGSRGRDPQGNCADAGANFPRAHRDHDEFGAAAAPGMGFRSC